MNKRTIVIKYGGNAMVNEEVKERLLKHLVTIVEKGHHVIIVHGGGPFIKQALADAKITSEFIDGQRKTTTEAMPVVEMALKGKVNGNIVGLINKLGHKAVGLSGKDGQLVIAKKRFHYQDGKKIDLGQVGDVKAVNAEILHLLMDNDFIPVITCLASDEEGNDYNINGDVFAGHIAGEMRVTDFIVLTDVDGLMKDIDQPDSLIKLLRVEQVNELIQDGTIKGGMIPKLEACTTALERGAQSSYIINGTKPEQLLDLLGNQQVGTKIIK